MSRFVSSILCAAFLLAGIPFVPAFETDQYNLSPEPLADIGEEVTSHVRAEIRLAMEDLNAQIGLHASCLGDHRRFFSKCESNEEETQKLTELRSEDAIAGAVYDRLGKGNIFTSS